MDRYACGDDSAFAIVYDALAPRLLGYLGRRAPSPEDAADLLQQTMLHIHRFRGDFIPGAAVGPWAFVIARRLLADSRRSKSPPCIDNAALEARASELPGADELVYARELGAHLERRLGTLPAPQQAAFELVRGDGLTMADAAKILGTTLGAAKLRAHRAYNALRAALSSLDGGLRRGPR